MATKTKIELVAVHVVEIDWTLPLDADIAGRSEDVQRVLDSAEEIAEASKVKLEPVLLQARDVGAAIVDEATERGADLLVVGLPYRKRFGGEFAIGRTIPYVLQNAPCAVWVVREPMTEGVDMKIVIVGCGRVGASAAELWDAPGTRSSSSTIDAARSTGCRRRSAGTAVRGDGTDEDVLRRAGTEGADVFLALTEGDNRNVMAAQLAVEAFGVARVIAKINDPVRADGLRRARHRDAVPDRPDDRRDQCLPRAAASGLAGMLAPTGHHPGGEDHRHARIAATS